MYCQCNVGLGDLCDDSIQNEIVIILLEAVSERDLDHLSSPFQ